MHRFLFQINSINFRSIFVLLEPLKMANVVACKNGVRTNNGKSNGLYRELDKL